MIILILTDFGRKEKWRSFVIGKRWVSSNFHSFEPLVSNDYVSYFDAVDGDKLVPNIAAVFVVVFQIFVIFIPNLRIV